ncbi:MAG: MBL fold metallo-hydrolase [Woeseiaceae bacterium]
MTRSLLVLLALSCCAVAADDDASYILVLGVAQDAGYPQANCYEAHCNRAWENEALRRTTSSIAVVDPAGRSKYLFDATPDIREQLFQLNRRAPDDEYRLAGVFLTHAHIGHYTGLMHFGHEASSSRDLPVYAMPRMRTFLTTNGPWDQLLRYGNIRLEELEDGRATSLPGGISVTPFLVPHRDEYSETVGYRIEGPHRTALFIPDIDKWSRWSVDIRAQVRSVDYALLDASFFADGELPGRDMSKIPHPFVAETMELLDELTEQEKARVIFIHMNHTNPLLIEGSQQQAEVIRRGFRIAREGMRLEL